MRRILSMLLIVAHFIAFGGIREALAFSMSGQAVMMPSGSVGQAGAGRASAGFVVSRDSLGEPFAGKLQGANFFIESGYAATIKSGPPVFLGIIANQSWLENESREGAFDLDDYFLSPDGYELTYSITGNQNITVEIDGQTHGVSFSQPQGWFGAEVIRFKAVDAEGAETLGNEVSLQVAGVDNAPVLDFIADITAKEGEEVVISARATDLDEDEITYSYTAPFNAQGRWQTGFEDAGTYLVTVTATDATGLQASQEVKIVIINVNRPPILEFMADVVVSEGELVSIVPQAVDEDGDAVVFYFSSPLDETGKWLTGFDDAGSYAATVTVSDGVDVVSQELGITVQNVNRPPDVSLTLNKYTAGINEEVVIRLNATDPDADEMSFVIKKNGQEIASGDLDGPYETIVTFSSAGDHAISVVVTDAGDSATESLVGVDIVDPNASGSLMFPVMGDFNGDALMDLGLYNGKTGTWEVALSQQGEFQNAVDWLRAVATPAEVSPVGGDFNGDGRADAGLYNRVSGELKVALSTGSGFSAPVPWLNFPVNGEPWQAFTGNFNGDKFTDFGLYNSKTGEVRVALGNGTGFTAFSTWLSGFGTNYSVLSGDFNGDSLADFCIVNKTSGEYKVALSNGAAFVDGSVWISGFGAGKEPVVSDYNNDGVSDIGYWDKTSGEWHYAVADNGAFVDKGLWLNFGSSDDEFVVTGDFNGDGISDMAGYDQALLGILRWKTEINGRKPADLLTRIDNGIGGRTEVVYSYASLTDNPGLPFPVSVASEIRMVDTLPVGSPQESYGQQFVFSDGYYDATEREFRGFGKVKAIDPVTGNFTETCFYQGKPGQDGALKGQIEKAIAFDGNGRQISRTVNTYDVRKAGPADHVLGFAALVRQDVTVYEENETSLSTASEFAYDTIGNLLESRSLGDAAKEGDEKVSQTVYAPAYTSGFCRPLEVTLGDKDGNIASRKNFEYDDRGNVTREIAVIVNPLSGSRELSQTSYTYDNFGNLLTATNALNQTATTEYETVFNAFPRAGTNSLGHILYSAYDPRLGVVMQSTDPNGNASSSFYDSLGRLTQYVNAYGQVTAEFIYPDFNTKVSRQGSLEKTEYVDGLGRKYKVVSSGEDGESARQVVSEVYYNGRGLVEKESIAHYVDENADQISYTRYEYDVRGRVKKAISDFPGTAKDAESRILYVSPLYLESIDPLGHKKGTLKDVYGNILEVTEFTQGGVYKITYQYDIQGNLVKVTDAMGNVTQIWYDSAGRKIKMGDPDMGVWRYEYDLIGNLVRQTDAKGQDIEFAYDDLNRLIQKVAKTPSHRVASETSYIYDEVTKENAIGRLSKVADGSGSTEFFYDKLGREVKSIKTVHSPQSIDHSYAVEREYDVYDRLIKLAYPDGKTVQYSYDIHSGLLEKVFSIVGESSAVDYVSDIAYDAAGRIKATRYGNGVTTTYSYGQDLRLARIHTNNDSTNLQDLNYIFDKNGNVQTLTDNLRNNVRTYVYDDLDRLLQAQNTPDPQDGYTTFYFQYDAIGNITYKSDVGVMTYGFNAGPHAVTSAGGYAYQYDANGNMISGKNKTLEYEAENRIIRIIQPDATTSFVYDGDGGRVKQTTVRGPQTTEITYIGSLFEIRQPQATGDKLQVKHIYAGSQKVCSIEAWSLQPAAISQYYYHGDHLGSSSIVTDETGQKVGDYAYTPYGSLINRTPDLSLRTSHLFTGQELDSTGLYFYSARYYDPEIGRFVTPDTIVQAPYDPQTLNRYAYCRNNPVNYVDPSGHWFFALLGLLAVTAAIGAVASTIMAGITGQITSWSAFWAAFGSGAAAGAVAGVGSLVPGAGTILGGILIGAAAGATGGAVGSAIGGAFSWGAVGMGAAFGGALGGFGNSSAGRALGRAIGKGIGKLPFGQNVQNFGQAIGNQMSQWHQEVKDGFARNFIKSSASITDRVIIRVEPADGIDPTGYRYVGPEEAAIIKETGHVPNVSKSGLSKNVFYTPEAPLASSSEAQSTYNLRNLPTHRVSLDTAKTTNIYGGNVDGASGIEMITQEQIPALDIQKLRK